MDLIRTVEPIAEAVSLKEVKDFLRAEDTLEDKQIITMIMASTVKLEKYLNRSLITQTWKYIIDRYPSKDTIKLMYGPIQSITSITSTLSNASTEVYANTNYFISNTNTDPAISLNYNTLWPTYILRPKSAVEIIYVTGYGDTSDDVPFSVHQGLLHMVAAMYMNREEGPVINDTIKSLVANERVYTF